MTASARLSSPAAERNRQPILDVLRRVLPRAGDRQRQRPARVVVRAPSARLDVAADRIRRGLAAVDRRMERAGRGRPLRVARSRGRGRPAPEPAAAAAPLPNVGPPLQLDVCASTWPVAGVFDAITCANMIHASPPQTLP